MEEITFEYIVRYLEDDLSTEERGRIENLSQNDTALAARIEEAKLLLNGIHLAGEKEVEEKVKSFHVEYSKSEEFSKLSQNPSPLHIVSKQLKWYAIAATGLLLFFVGYSMFRTTKEQKLFAQYNIEESSYLSTQIEFLGRSGMASPDVEKRKLLRQGLTAYSNKKYTEGVVNLTDYLKKYPADSLAELYLALNYLASGNYSQAETILRQLTLSPNNEIRDISSWYLSLLNIRFKNNYEARLLLRSILQNPTSTYFDRARSLLNEIQLK